MPLDIRLYSASYLVELDDTPYGIEAQMGGLGSPQADHSYASVWGRGYHPLTGVSYGNRNVELSLFLRGTSQDNWIVQQRNIDQLLLDTRQYWESGGARGDKAVLFVQLNGQTNGVEFDVLSGELAAGEVFRSTMTSTGAPSLRGATLQLTVKPFARPQALTRLTSPTITNGGGTTNATNAYRITAPLGDIKTPAELRFQSATGDAFRRVIVGRKTRGNVANLITRFEAEPATYAGYNTTFLTAGVTTTGGNGGENITEASGSNGTVRRLHFRDGGNAAAQRLRFVLETNLPDYYGRYRAYARVDSYASAIPGLNLNLEYGGAEFSDIVNTTVAPAVGSDFLVDLGLLTIPHRIGSPDAALSDFRFQIRVGVTASDDDTIDLDCVYLVPVDEDYVDVSLSTAAAAQDQLVANGLLPTPSAYLLDSSGDLQPETLTLNAYTGLSLEPGVDNLLVPLVVSSTGLSGHNLTDAFTLRADYHPLYAQFRTS